MRYVQIQAYEVIAGTTFRSCTERELACQIINEANERDIITQADVIDAWQELAALDDDEVSAAAFEDLLEDAELPPFCGLEWHDGELVCLPHTIELAMMDVATGDELPDESSQWEGELFAVVNDHGNVRLYQQCEYQWILCWGAV